MQKQIILFSIIILSFSHAQNISTKGKEFWLSYMENINLGLNGIPDFTILISSDVNTSGNISIPQTGFNIPYNVTANIPTEITLPENIYYPQGDETIFNFGLKITAEDSVNIYTYHHRLYFNEASIVLPSSELSYQYLANTFDGFPSANQYPSEFVILATQNNTIIEITPSVLTIGFRTPLIPFQIELDEGQVFQLQSYSDLTGSLIKSVDSLKKIAVFGGSKRAAINCQTADNHLYEQIYPEKSAATNFVLVPFNTNGYDVFRLLATEDSTVINFNSESIYINSRGDYRDTLISSPVFIRSSKPILVSQFKPSQDCSVELLGDPTMLNLTPINLLKRKATFKSVDVSNNSQMTSPKHFINIITKTTSTSLVTLDDNPISNFSIVPNSPDYSFAVIENLSAGTHSILCEEGFNAFAYGLAAYDSYSFHLGYDKFNSNNLEIIDKPKSHFFITNPTKDNLIIQFLNKHKTLKIQVINNQGKSVYSNEIKDLNSKLELDISNLSIGIYFVELIIDGNYYTEKIIKE